MREREKDRKRVGVKEEEGEEKMGERGRGRVRVKEGEGEEKGRER